MAPADPILGVTEAYVADQNPKKVNLGVGVYYDDNGKVPLLECVKRAEEARVKASLPKGYLPIDGIAAYDKLVQELVFSKVDKNIVTVQALGGTGGLKIGADFLRQISPQSQVWISDPSWENHRQLFEAAGFVVKNYPYYDAKTRGLDFAGMTRALEALPAGTIVVLHSCCHNPTGVDLTNEQWVKVLGIVSSRGLIPFLDLAYQGFADGLDADAYAARLFADAMSPVFLSSSFSKSFSLYGERVGALSVVTGGEEEAKRVLSNLKRIVRTNYSNPPTHGAQVVAQVLSDDRLRALWEEELASMRVRIKAMRGALVAALKAAGVTQDLSFVTEQLGMFSYSGLTAAQMQRLRDEFGVYGVDSGRICVAALNEGNLPTVAAGMAAVMKG